jgi:acyl CoA:acetate/3-ketoacid CoA transferase alpha subunit
MKVLDEGIGKLIQPVDLDAFRKSNHSKPKQLIDKRMSEAEAVGRFIHDGDYVGTELYGTVRCPMSLVNEIIRQGVKDLRLVGQGVTELDILLAAKLVKALDLTYVGLEVYGVSSVFRREVESGRVETCVEWSNGALVSRFKAAAMGVPFVPIRSMLGTDTFKFSAAKTVECPFTGDPICLVPALILDVGLIHVHRADKYGNAQIDGISGFATEMARASKRLIVSAEEIIPSDEIRKNPSDTVIPYFLVDAVVEAPFGSHPGEMCYVYERDEPQIKEWVEESKTEEGAQKYIDKYIHGVNDHQGYLDMIGKDRLEQLQAMVPGRS